MESSEIRKSYIDLISGVIGVPGFDTSIPIDIVPLPDSYFLVSNVSRIPTPSGKAFQNDITAFRHTENRVFINVDICSVNELGFDSSISVESYVDTVIDTVKRALNPVGVYVKETKVTNVVPLNMVTATHNIQRMVISFEHWVSKKV